MRVINIDTFKQKAMQWASTFEVCCFLDSNNYVDAYSQHGCLIAVGATHVLDVRVGNAFEQLKYFYNLHQDWMFGLLSYELKNEIENLRTNLDDQLDFPDLYFFVPEHLIAIKDNEVQVLKGDQATIINQIENLGLAENLAKKELNIIAKIDRENYISIVEELKITYYTWRLL